MITTTNSSIQAREHRERGRRRDIFGDGCDSNEKGARYKVVWSCCCFCCFDPLHVQMTWNAKVARNAIYVSFALSRCLRFPASSGLLDSSEFIIVCVPSSNQKRSDVECFVRSPNPLRHTAIRLSRSRRSDIYTRFMCVTRLDALAFALWAPSSYHIIYER